MIFNPFYGMVTPRPDKIVPDRARPKNGFPELPFGYIKDIIWCCLAHFGQLPLSFLQTSGPGSQTDPAAFSSGSV